VVAYFLQQTHSLLRFLQRPLLAPVILAKHVDLAVLVEKEALVDVVVVMVSHVSV
jgi:hypothetical protein